MSLLDRKAAIIIQNDLFYLPICKSFVESFLNLIKLEKDLSNKIILITEEAMVHTIKYSYEPEEKGDIKFTIKLDNHQLILSFYDTGMPFDPSEIKAYDPNKKNISEIDTDPLGLFLIDKIADNVKWINHGKKGKELQISFKLPIKDITEISNKDELKLFKEEVELAPPQNYDIHHARDKEFYQISKCIYKTYGYSYPNEDMYYPEKIKSLNEVGKLISVVATDEKGNVVGHYALERYDLGQIAETGQAIVDPRHRKRRLMERMRNKLEEIAKELGLKGIYSQPVTSHTASQKVNRKFGSKPFGISLAYAPKSLHFKKLINNKLFQRESCMYYFKPLVNLVPKKIYIWEKYIEIVKFIYKNAGFPEYIFLKSKGIPDKKRGSVETNYYPSWGFGVISVKNIAEDTLSLIKKGLFYLTMKGDAEIVYLMLPIEREGSDILMKKANELGFIFSGIAPFALDGEDALKMQFPNHDLNLDLLKVEGDDAKKILEFIKKEYKELDLGNIKI